MKKPVLTLLPRTALRVSATLTVLAIAATSTLAFPLLTNVVETGGDNEATDTITAQWTGVTWNTTVANEPILNTPVGTPYTVPGFGEDVPCMVDRATQWNGARADLPIPGYLLGGEYIMIGNDNRDNTPFQVDLYLSERSVVYVIVENRCGDIPVDGANNSDDPPFHGRPLDQWTGMTWVYANGFAPLISGYNRDASLAKPDEVGYDEVSSGVLGVGPGNGINQYASVYYKLVEPGAEGSPAIQLGEQNNTLVGGGFNMYGVVVTTVMLPAAPGNVRATSMNGRVILTWSRLPGATNYIIRRSDVSGGPYTDIATSAAPGWTDSTVVNGQVYYYVVAAMGVGGTGGNSAQVIGTPKLAPESLVATGGTTQVTLSWAAMDGAASYTVKRGGVSGGPFTNIASGITATSLVDTGLASGRIYYYTVFATLAGGGESTDADGASAVTAASVSAGFRAECFAATVIRLTWSSTDQVPPTTLVEKSANGTDFTQVGAVTDGGTRYFDVGLGPNTTNYYRVRATNSGGFSVYTEVASASTPAGGVNVNFAADTFTTSPGFPIPGYLNDFGYAYGDQGNGYSYGWEQDNTSTARYRNLPNSPDERYDTLMHLQKADPSGHVWEIGLSNGLYQAHIVSGDPDATDGVFQFDVEGWVSVPKSPTDENRWADFLMTVKVEDERMTFNNGPSASNNKICFVDIYPTTPQPNTITTQPISQTVTQNLPVSLSVVVGGGPEPYRYQWYGPAGPIAGAESATYTIPYPQPSDSGIYYVVVTNAGASVQSSNATLTVIPDTIGPVCLQARRAAACSDTTVILRFDELLDPVSAMDPNSYEIVNLTYGFSLGAPVWAVLAADGKTVTLTAAAPPTNTALYEVIIKNVKDLALSSSGIVSTLLTLNGPLQPIGPQNLVVVEAENYDVNTPRMFDSGSGYNEYYWIFENTRAGFSGAGVMHNLPDVEGNRPGGAEGCSLDYCVNFPAAATYYVWVRGGADASGDNSIHIGLDGMVPATGVNLQEGFGTDYAWCGWINAGTTDRATVDVPAAGYHTVHIFMREDGFFADKLLLTTDIGYTPSGLGPDETPREPANVPMIAIIPGSLAYGGTSFGFALQTVEGVTNVVEYKGSLADPAWMTLTSFTGNGTIVPITDPGPMPASRFFRARVVIP